MDDAVEDEEPVDFDEPDEARDGEAEKTDDANIVQSGDAPGAGRGVPSAASAKKIPEDERKTTPYMTKYERARVLGTRALQIRCASSHASHGDCPNWPD